LFNKETIGTNSKYQMKMISLGLSCNLQIELTWAVCDCWQRRTWAKLLG